MKNKRVVITAPLFVAIILFLIPISEKLLKLTAASDSNILLSASAVQLFIFAIPVAFYCKIRGVDFPSYAKLRHLSLSHVPFAIAAAFTYLFTAIIILYLEYSVFTFPSDNALSTVTALSDDSFGTALAYVIIPAIAEELFFRSIILSDYAEFKGSSTVIVSALFFAMLHFSFIQFPLYFILGIILGTMTYVTGTSVPAITVHMINNALVIFFGNGIGAFLNESASSIILAFLLVVAFLGSLTAMLSSMEAVYEKRSVLFDAGELPGSRRETVKNITKAGKVEHHNEKDVMRKTASIFLSPTFFFCILIFVLITLDIV